MSLTYTIIFSILCTLATSSVNAAAEVTHEDIRDAILSLVTIFRDNGDKLERHEFRERQLGEQLKKALAGLDKRYRMQDQTLEKIVLMLEKQDERLRLIESTVLQKDEKERNQLQAITDGVQKIDKTLDKLVKEFMTPPRINGATYTVHDPAALDSSAASRLDTLTEMMKQQQEKTTKLMNYMEERQMASSAASSGSLGLKEVLEKQHATLQNVLHITTRMANEIRILPSKLELQEAINGTYDSLQEIRDDLTAGTERGVGQILNRLRESVEGLSGKQEDLLKTTSEIQSMSEELHTGITKSYEQLLGEIKGLSKVEQVMIQTADNVMDTKRRIEYGVHQILLEVGNLVKGQGKALNGTVNKRFDDIESTILDNQTGALSNLSSKIETEISQVWRQIGIMYQQLSASATALDRLQQQTDAYVNGSVKAMDSMEGKVGMITSRMTEVDENLNFLLGRLSLVTSEFNQIKSGLANALDNIRNSFLEVQKEIKDVGPGPRPIAAEKDRGNDVLSNE